MVAQPSKGGKKEWSMQTNLTVVVVLLATLGCSSTDDAAVRAPSDVPPDPAATTTVATPATPKPENREEAKAHYALGLQYAEAHRYADAAREMQAAYDLFPSYRVFYSLAVMHTAIGDEAAALDAYDKYLAGGADEIPANRRAEVEKAMASLRENKAHAAPPTAKP
jgi:Tfp pilus assembly protein PilF